MNEDIKYFSNKATDIDKLVDILSYRRQHNSPGIEAFKSEYFEGFDTLKNEKGEDIAYTFNNSDASLSSSVLWSCHIDTMHRGEPEKLRQEVFVDMEGTAFVDASCQCLGADDGAGVFMLLEMAKAGVPGQYIWNFAEEVGCLGSKQVERLFPDWLSTFTHAIAFDRRDNHSIITHQMGERMCSDEMALHFSNLLNMGHELDPTGSYTDTAQWSELVPECVNFSIGYSSEHSSSETCDIGYVMRLKDAICAVTDWNLPVVRDPAVKDYETSRVSMLNVSNKKLNAREPLSSSELRSATPEAVVAYCKSANANTIAWTIEDLIQEIMDLESKLSDDWGIKFDDYGDEHSRLDAGMQ